ncbi:MAG: N-acetylneuraminate synthase family protein [Patescibacteria group bacterium]|nr:N-acetylneuraminate synthase family protein [Patescibacteria group bacterium]
MKHNQLPTIQIGQVKFGPNEPVVVIAEGCDNHNGSVSRAKEMAHAAKDAGAQMIKFQLHLPDEEMDREGMRQTSSEMFSKFGDLYGFIEQNLLSVEGHAEVIEYCEKIGIQYFCTPFSLKAAQILNELGVGGFKIGSGETEDLPMIEEMAKMNKPMMISTGMTELDEIDLTVNAVNSYNTPLLLAHCISNYAQNSLSQLKLGTLRMLEERYGVLIGFSDHTPPEGIATNSGRRISEETLMWSVIGNGACFVEKHFTLDRTTPDADSSFSHDPNTLRNLVQYVRDAKSALIAERKVFEDEKAVHIWAKRSMFAAKDIPAGVAITRDMLISKRPGTGIRSKYYKEIVLGKTARANISAGSMLKREDLI